MKNLNTFIFAFALMFIQFINAQDKELNIPNPSLVAEQIFIHYNSSFFLPGEKLQYSVYNLNEKTHRPSEISKIARVLLIDSNETTIFSHSLNLKDGVAYSDFLIPSSLPTGSYKLVGYTNWMNNYKKPGIFKADIFVINPYLNKEIKNNFGERQISESKHSTPSSILSSQASELKLNKESFGTRDKVVINLDQLNINMNNSRLSLSVRKIDSTLSINPKKSNEFKNHDSGYFSFKSFPEYRGQNIKGQVLDSSNNPVNKNFNLIFSVPNRTDKFRIFTTNAKGIYNFQLSDIVDYSTAKLHILEEQTESFHIVQDTGRIDFSQTDFPDIPIDNLDKENLKKRLIHHQIEQYYKSVKSDSIFQYPVDKLFYGNRAKIYNLDDYTRFNTMNETFVEIIQFVSFNSRRNNPIIQISDSKNPNAAGGVPLVLVDGMAVSNHDLIYQMNPNSVESISVLVEKYHYGPSFYQGVLDIRTKKQSFYDREKSFSLKLKPAEKPREYFTPEYTSDKLQMLSRIPDYRYQLYWLPEINSNNIEFYTSDVTGNYEIRIEGFLENGNAVSVYHQFSVSNNL